MFVHHETYYSLDLATNIEQGKDDILHIALAMVL